jgi:hypothetical protein
LGVLAIIEIHPIGNALSITSHKRAFTSSNCPNLVGLKPKEGKYEFKWQDKAVDLFRSRAEAH